MGDGGLRITRYLRLRIENLELGFAENEMGLCEGSLSQRVCE